MQAVDITSDVLQDPRALDARAPTPQHRLSRLLASLRASVALVSGRYLRGERRLKPRREASELDPVERLARMMILPPYY